MILFLCLLAAGFVALSRAEDVWTLAPACLLLGTGMGGTLGPMMALLADLTPGDRMGRASGTTTLFSDVGGGLGPVVALPVIDRVGFEPVYLAAALCPLVAVAVLAVGMYRHTGRVFPATTTETEPGPGAERDIDGVAPASGESDD